MNISNVETQNAMGTIRAGQANIHLGLIKSASTSSCCANESFTSENLRKAIHQQSKQHYVPHKEAKPLIADTLSSSSSHSGTTNSVNHIHSKLKYNNVKHFSDCDLDVHKSRDLANNFASLLATNYTEQKEKEKFRTEFCTHNYLDKVLINGNDHSFINFTTAVKNELNGEVAGAESNELNFINNSTEVNNYKGEDCSNAVANNANVKSQINDTVTLEEKASCGLDKTEVKSCNESNNTDSSSVEIAAGDTETNTQNINIQSDNAESAKTPKVNDMPSREESTSIRSSALLADNTVQSAVEEAPKKEKPFRRCSSLKIHRENNSSPAQKKIVRFADVLGLDLADVRTFLDELPSVPKSAYDDIDLDELSSANGGTTESASAKIYLQPSVELKSLVPSFQQPGMLSDFLDRIRDDCVCLETATVSDSPVCFIAGTVRVRNLDFHKSVHVRYSLDNWETFAEVQASYVADSCDGFSDKFSFVVYVYNVNTGQKIQLAVRFHCSGCIFWDNNKGKNYVFQCLPTCPSMPSYFECVSPSSATCNSFY